MKIGRALALSASFLVIASCATRPDADLARIENIVVIYAENRSFDHLYGLFPGAEGIAQATPEQKTQLDHDGTPLPHLPPTWEHGKASVRLATENLPNGPFRIDAPPINGRMNEILPNPWHVFYQNREQTNGWRNNLFAAMSNLPGWGLGPFDAPQVKRWTRPPRYTLADPFVSC